MYGLNELDVLLESQTTEATTSSRRSSLGASNNLLDSLLGSINLQTDKTNLEPSSHVLLLISSEIEVAGNGFEACSKIQESFTKSLANQLVQSNKKSKSKKREKQKMHYESIKSFIKKNSSSESCLLLRTYQKEKYDNSDYMARKDCTVTRDDNPLVSTSPTPESSSSKIEEEKQPKLFYPPY